MKKNKIIIALNKTDSPNSLASYGASLAKRLDRDAMLTSVAKTPVLTSSTGVGGSKIQAFQMNHINEVKKEIEVDLNNVCLETKKIWPRIGYEVEIGFLEATLIEKSKEEKPFLFLIEGEHQHSTIAEWFGTYETRMAAQINVPTLIVPAQYYWKPVHDILYVMKMEDNKARNIRVLHDVAVELNANLHIMMIAEDESPENYQNYNRIISTLKTFYSYEHIQYHFVSDIKSTDEIKKMTDNLMVNWMAFEHEDSSFIDRLFSGLNSERMILQADIPVMVF